MYIFIAVIPVISSHAFLMSVKSKLATDVSGIRVIMQFNLLEGFYCETSVRYNLRDFDSLTEIKATKNNK